jgi:hypothetical protein
VRTEKISEIVQINGKYQKRVKELLDLMQKDYEESK